MSAITSPTFLLSDRKPTYGMSGKSLRYEHELADDLARDPSSSTQKGTDLARLVSTMPRTDDEWKALGLASYGRDVFRSAGLAVVAAAATNMDVARAFVLELGHHREALAGTPFNDQDFLATCVLRAWNFSRHSPQAIGALVESFAAELTPERFLSLIRRRYLSLRSERGSDPTSPSELLKFDEGLEAIRSRSIAPDNARLIDSARDAIAAHIADEKAKVERQTLTDAAHEAARRCRNDCSIADLDEFTNAAEALAVIAPDSATVLLLKTLDKVRSSQVDHTALEADSRLNAQLDRIKAAHRAGTPISDEAGRVIRDILARNSLEATVIRDNYVVIDEALLRKLSDLADSFGVSFDAPSARRTLVEEIPGKQALLDAEHLIGVDLNDLPSDVVSVGVNFGQAQLLYQPQQESTTGRPPVEELIQDIETYFVHGGRSPEEVDVAKAVATGRSDTFPAGWGLHEQGRIFRSLSEELRNWYRSGAVEPFHHSQDDGLGTPYKYSGTAFSGCRFSASLADDGAILFTISGGGYSYDSQDPSKQSVKFANALGKAELVEYQSPPTFRFMIARTAEPLGAHPLEGVQRTTGRRFSDSAV